MRLIVDNSEGGDKQLADEITRILRDRGLEVERREPTREARFDTAVHLVTAGLVIRVSEAPDRALRQTVHDVVRGVLERAPSARRRARSVPIQLGESGRVLEWIDVFE